MSEKILYLLGAGASAQALPIVKDSPDGKIKGMAKAMIEMAEFMKGQTFENDSKPFIDEFILHLHELANESENFTTIDTYAKHLYLTDGAELEKLKVSLSLFFCVEQIYFKKLDKRYLIFLTTILDRLIFPDNIKILTWNYDFQMELTGYRYWPEEIHHNNHTGVTVSRGSMFSYFPPAGNVFSAFADNANYDEFQILHLNGIAGIYNFVNSYLNGNIFIKTDTEAADCLQQIVKHFLHQGKDKIHLLQFAWEQGNTNASEHMRKKMLFADSIASDTTILVVIGYSFPYFNRNTDKQIFDKLRESGKLKKIYFQDPYLDGSFLKNQFGLNDIEIEHIKRIDSFFVPMEL